MKKIFIILLAVFVASCGSTREVYNLDLTLTNGKVVTRQYRLPKDVTLSIKGKGCLIYKKKDNTCYCLVTNVIKFKRN